MSAYETIRLQSGDALRQLRRVLPAALSHRVAVGGIGLLSAGLAVTLLLSVAAVSKEDPDSSACQDQTWPYIAQTCLKASAAPVQLPTQPVRVITPHTTASPHEAVLAARAAIARERENAAREKSERGPRAAQDTVAASAGNADVDIISVVAPVRAAKTVRQARRSSSRIAAKTRQPALGGLGFFVFDLPRSRHAWR